MSANRKHSFDSVIIAKYGHTCYTHEKQSGMTLSNRLRLFLIGIHTNGYVPDLSTQYMYTGNLSQHIVIAQ